MQNLKTIVGRSADINELRALIKVVGPSDATAGIVGESGTGKELVAHAIHHNSQRVDKPFVRINCGAIPENLIESELFDAAGFKTLHVAGHPEGNKDIDPDGTTVNVDAALKWKQNYKSKTDAKMAIATQFAFEAGPIIEWANSIKNAGIDIPIHIGIAGPAKLQTLIKFAIACGVGPSLKVLPFEET